MTVWQAFLEAQKVIRRKRGLVGVLFVINILVAAVLTIPVGGRLEKLARTALADKLIHGFSFDYFYEYWGRYGDSFDAIFIAAIGIGVLYIFLNTFFAGGILAILSQEKNFTLRAFLRESGNFFGRFFRLLLFSLVLLLIFAFGFQLLIVKPFLAYAKQLEPDGSFRVYLLIGCFALLLLGFWNMLLDYSKIVMFSRDLRSVWKGFFAGSGFAFRHFLQATGLYYLNYGILILLFILYLFIESFFSNATALQTYLLLIIQQIFIISRLWMKISFFGSQQLLYFDRRPAEAVQLAVAGSY